MKLNRIDLTTNSQCIYLDPTDQCFYFGEYGYPGGYNLGVVNQQIFNLKCPPTKTHRLHYKSSAVDFWARHLQQAFGSTENYTFLPVPPSKSRDSPDYDPRMSNVLSRLGELTGRKIDCRDDVITQSRSREQQSSGHGRETPESLSAIYEFAAPREPLKEIVIIDDVITRGASFAAMKLVLTRNFGSRQIVGVFMALAVAQQPDISVEPIRAQ